MRIRKHQQLRVDDAGSVLLPFLDTFVESKSTCSGEAREPDNGGVAVVYSASKFRASINWLNKLRAAKGFPVEPDLSIEDFLSFRTSVSPRESHAGSSTPDGNYSDRADLRCVDNFNVHRSRTFNTGVHQVYERSSERQGRAATCGLSKNCVLDTANGLLSSAALRNNQTAAMESECGRSSTTEASCGLRVSGERHSAKLLTRGNDHKEENSSVILTTQSAGLGKSALFADARSHEAGGLLSRQSVNVFADLFCMDDSSDEKWNVQAAGAAKKHKRKQGKPKICSALSDTESPGATTTSSPLQMVEMDHKERCDEDDKTKAQLPSEVDATKKVDTPSTSPEKQITLEDIPAERINVDDAAGDCSKVRQNREIPLCSRNEVFVIDTSVRGWRVEKIIIRKGSSLKIKDKCIVTCVDNSDTTIKLPGSKKRARTPHLNQMKTDKSTPERMQCQLGSIEKVKDVK